MQIEIPDELYEDFVKFLDMAQASFTEEEIESFSENEKKLIKWVETFLGEKKSSRFKNQEEFAAHVQDNFKKQIGLLEDEIYASKKT
jgi:hypothetical protein